MNDYIPGRAWEITVVVLPDNGPYHLPEYAIRCGRCTWGTQPMQAIESVAPLLATHIRHHERGTA